MCGRDGVQTCALPISLPPSLPLSFSLSLSSLFCSYAVSYSILQLRYRVFCFTPGITSQLFPVFRSASDAADIKKPYQSTFNGGSQPRIGNDDGFDADYTEKLRKLSENQYTRSSTNLNKPSPTRHSSTSAAGSPGSAVSQASQRQPYPSSPSQPVGHSKSHVSVVLPTRSEEHTSELQSRPHISYAVFCLKKKKKKKKTKQTTNQQHTQYNKR